MIGVLKLDICLTNPTHPFICGVYGPASVDTLGIIECDLNDWVQDQNFDISTEMVTVTAKYVEAEYHEDRVAIPGYWDLQTLSTAPMLDLSMDSVVAEIEAHGWAWTCRKTRDTTVEQEEHQGAYIARIWTVLPDAPGVHYLGIEYAQTPATALYKALSQVQASAEVNA
ncbi:hypothetical protein [Deinococcus ruber]|uniref:Uncharacterized protein n=1 Tax=Deinococcus ruber TaxID=1848197 RepID=A0A918CMT1_9DEIO|nr:hypothetical protein [Deinococcus ruber]GGR31274.1 hypothetical protein GCM10008957_47430 [Deinococcus ruber]